MSELLLVDASVWIAAGRKGGDPEIATRLGRLLDEGKAAMAYPVWFELYQGIRGEREEARLEASRSLCTWLDFDDACWKQAAVVARACLRAGVNVPFGDVLVHACARRHGVGLFEHDRHFAMIRGVMGEA